MVAKREMVPPPASLRETTAKLKASNDRLERELKQGVAGKSGEWLLEDLQEWRVTRAAEREAALKGMK